MLEDSSKTFLRLSLATALAICLFCTPLIIRYRYFKEYQVSLTTSDVVSVNKRVSPVWCEAQNLTMRSEFKAYLLPRKPPISRVKRNYVFNEHFVLPSGSTEVWGFYLIQESVLTLRACPKKRGAMITIIKGKDILMNCLEYHALHLNDDESLESGESSETAEEIDDKFETHESTVSSSEGVNSNETEGHEFECHGALERQETKGMPTCYRSHLHDGLNDSVSKQYHDELTIKLTAKSSDKYYVVFSSSHAELDGIPLPNEIYARIELERRAYNLSETYQSCSNVNGTSSCVFDTPWGNQGFVVVEYGKDVVDQEEGTLSSDVLVSFCKPRKWMYFGFYLVLFLLIFVCAFQ